VKRRITIVTAGHLATCPRMVKAADLLQGSGYAVRVVSVQHTSWASEGDASLRRTRTWRWDPVACGRDEAPMRWLVSGVGHRGALTLARTAADAMPWVRARAFSRVHDLLVAEVLREPADLVYGGTSGALTAIAEAARRSGTPFAVDFEDFHCGERDDAGVGRALNRLASAVMKDVAYDAAFLTAGSAAIADACACHVGRPVTAVHNVFPLPSHAPAAAPPNVLRFYWFSQTIGAGRGLEDVIHAAGALATPCELHLRGSSANGYMARLQALASERAPSLTVCHHAPAAPDAMVDACRDFTIGLATEPGHTANNALSLSNKALTYPLAGLPVVLTDTPGQRALQADLGAGGLSYRAGDAASLAASLEEWIRSPRALRDAGEASWQAARRRWHWGHADEQGALLACVRKVLS
jgi:hypothetical protein